MNIINQRSLNRFVSEPNTYLYKTIQGGYLVQTEAEAQNMLNCRKASVSEVTKLFQSTLQSIDSHKYEQKTLEKLASRTRHMIERIDSKRAWYDAKAAKFFLTLLSAGILGIIYLFRKSPKTELKKILQETTGRIEIMENLNNTDKETLTNGLFNRAARICKSNEGGYQFCPKDALSKPENNHLTELSPSEVASLLDHLLKTSVDNNLLMQSIHFRLQSILDTMHSSHPVKTKLQETLCLAKEILEVTRHIKEVTLLKYKNLNQSSECLAKILRVSDSIETTSNLYNNISTFLDEYPFPLESWQGLPPEMQPTTLPEAIRQTGEFISSIPKKGQSFLHGADLFMESASQIYTDEGQEKLKKSFRKDAIERHLTLDLHVAGTRIAFSSKEEHENMLPEMKELLLKNNTKLSPKDQSLLQCLVSRNKINSFFFWLISSFLEHTLEKVSLKDMDVQIQIKQNADGSFHVNYKYLPIIKSDECSFSIPAHFEVDFTIAAGEKSINLSEMHFTPYVRDQKADGLDYNSRDELQKALLPDSLKRSLSKGGSELARNPNFRDLVQVRSNIALQNMLQSTSEILTAPEKVKRSFESDFHRTPYSTVYSKTGELLFDTQHSTSRDPLQEELNSDRMDLTPEGRTIFKHLLSGNRIIYMQSGLFESLTGVLDRPPRIEKSSRITQEARDHFHHSMEFSFDLPNSEDRFAFSYEYDLRFDNTRNCLIVDSLSYTITDPDGKTYTSKATPSSIVFSEDFNGRSIEELGVTVEDGYGDSTQISEEVISSV